MEQLSKEFIVSMKVGNAVGRNPEMKEVTKCADFAKYIYDNSISSDSILGENLQVIIANGMQAVLKGMEIPMRNDAGNYDDFARGFLAGEILGVPNDKNVALAMRANRIWDDDLDEGWYGYYQDVLNEIKEVA